MSKEFGPINSVNPREYAVGARTRVPLDEVKLNRYIARLRAGEEVFAVDVLITVLARRRVGDNLKIYASKEDRSVFDKGLVFMTTDGTPYARDGAGPLTEEDVLLMGSDDYILNEEGQPAGYLHRPFKKGAGGLIELAAEPPEEEGVLRYTIRPRHATLVPGIFTTGSDSSLPSFRR